MPQNITEHFEITAKAFIQLSAKASLWSATMDTVVESDKGYTFEELVTLTIQHVNPYAVKAGYGKMGKRDVLGGILNELHANNGVRRFAKGFYETHGHEPYGVLWMVKWS